MLKLSILEIILRLIPEGILNIMSVYVFSAEKINLRKIFLSGTLLANFLYFIRILPIEYGVHTLIYLIVFIFIVTWVNKIDTSRAMSSSLISMMILSICDWVSFFIMANILKSNVKNIMSNPWLKILYGLPSLVLYICIIFVSYKIIYRNRKVSKNVYY